MRVVIQRVSEAKVDIGGQTVSTIGKGLLILLGVENNDNSEDIRWLCKKIISLRIFDDENGVMNISVKDTGSDLMVVSQFTLYASTRKGNRPSWIKAAQPAQAEIMYDEFCKKLSDEAEKNVCTGRFGAMMKVTLINDGPVTIIIDSKIRE